MTSSEYLQLALECIRDAESATDEAQKKALLGMAKLWNETALKMESGAAPSPDSVPSTA